MVLFHNEHEVVPGLIDQSEANETKTQLGKSKLLVIYKLLVFLLLQLYYSISLYSSYSHSFDIIFSANFQDFDQCHVYDSCFPLCEIPEWFSHQSDEPPVTFPFASKCVQ